MRPVFVSMLGGGKTNRIVVVGCLALAGYTLILGAYVWNNQLAFDSRKTAVFWESHSREVLLESGVARSSLQDAETAQRGFLITQRADYLEPYNSGVSALHVSLHRLALLTVDNASQQMRIERLRDVIAAKLGELQATVALVEQENLHRALAIIATDRGKDLMDAARKQFKAFDAEERRLLKSRQAASEAEDRRRQVSIYVLAALCLVTLLAGGGGVGFLFRLSGQLQAAGALAASKALFHAIVTCSADGIISFRPDYIVQTWNEGAENIYGWTAAEAIGRSLLSLIVPVKNRPEFELMQQEVRAGRSVHVETVRQHKDGYQIDVSVDMAPIFEGSKLVSVSSIARDITERQRADRVRGALEAELRESESQLQLVISAADLATWVVDLGTNLPVARSLRHDQMFGYAELQPHWSVDIAELHVLDEDKATFRQGMKIARETGVLSFEVRVCWPDGSVHWVSPWGRTYYDDDGQPIRMAGVIRDVTARREADAALRESEARLQLAVEATGLGIIDRDFGRGLYTWTDQLWRLLGLRPGLEAPCTAIWLSAIHPDDLPAVRALCDVTWNNPAIPFDCEYRVVWPDGSVHWLKAQARALLGPDNLPMRAICAMVDITDSRENEATLRHLSEELEQREARIRSILATVPDGMILIDEQGIMQSFSATAEKMFGCPASEAVGSNVSVLMGDVDRERHDDYLQHYFATGERRVIGKRRVLHGQRKDGSAFPMELSVGEVQIGGRRQFTGFIRDITERTATQARLQQLQTELAQFSRVRAAGAMASTLAHELNQPLTATISAVRAARRMLAAAKIVDAPEGLVRAMDLAAEQALRAGQIIQRLREFVARGGEADKRPEEVQQLVDEANTLALIGLAEAGIDFTSTIDAGLPPVMVDRVQIQQVLVNLIRNAVQAMAEQGRDLSGGAKALQKLIVTARLGTPGIVEIAVADTGPGLSPEVLSRLFEPFITTKPSGMGVGLSICRQLIEAHGGQLWAEANPGGGAVFRFTLETALDSATVPTVVAV